MSKENIYLTYYSKVKRVIKKYIDYNEAVEELVTDTFIRFFDKYGNSVNEDIEKILYTIAKNIAIDYLRAEKRRLKLLGDYEIELNDPSQEIDYSNQIDTIRSIIDNNIAYRYKLVLDDYYVHERSYADIGKRLGLSYNTVKVLMSRAKASVRNPYSQRGLGK